MLIYGPATMGATVHLHYCMNEFVGWNLFEMDDEKCGKCGMIETDDGGCCKDEHKHYKLKVDHQKAGAANFINIIAPAELPILIIDANIHSSITSSKQYPTSHAPPNLYKLRLHLLHCTFLI